MAFRVPANKIPSGVPAAFVPPEYPAGTDNMAKPPVEQIQKCGLAVGDFGSSWSRGVKCAAYLPGDKSVSVAIDAADCSSIPEPAGGKDETYSYTVGGCDGGWEVGAWGARTPAAAPARLAVNRQQTRPAMMGAPKHYTR